MPFDGVPLAASVAADALVAIFVILLAAKLGDELMKRLGQPSVIGEIAAGVIVGPAVLGIVEPGPVLDVFAELGVVFLLFWVGLETRLSEMLAVGRSAASAGVLGVLFPFAAGFAIAMARGDDSATSTFVGAALVATSVGITSAVLLELGVLGRRWSRTILGAAVIDDILAMLIVAVAVGLAEGGGSDRTDIIVTFALAVGFVLFFALGGTQFFKRMPHVLRDVPRFSDSPLMPAVLVCLGLAALAAHLGLAAIIGAFLAGMMVAETQEVAPVEHEVAPLYAFFPPFFFAAIGLQVDLAALADWGTLGLLALVTVVAVVTKLVGAALGAAGLGRRHALLVGVGMVPRGEVGIIIAGLGRAEGVFSDRMFVVIVSMSIITTLVVPPVLRRLARADPESPADGVPPPTVDAAPSG